MPFVSMLGNDGGVGVKIWTAEDARLLAGKRVLITGATGFIGSHLLRKLINLGCRVVMLDQPSANPWRIADISSKLENVPCDLRRLDETIQAMQSRLSGVEIIYHLAAAGVDQSNQDAALILQTNVVGTLRLLQLAQRLNIERFIYCGSCFEYGAGERLSEDSLPMPNSEYGASKSAAWFLVNAFHRRYGLPVVSLRPFNVYGPMEAGHRLIPHAIMRALNGLEIGLTGGEQKRDFLFIADLIEAFLSAAVTDTVGGTFNVCTGLATSVKGVVTTIVELTGQRVQLRFGDLPYRDIEVPVLSGDPKKAREKLGWIAQTSLRDGLSKTIAWFRDARSKYPTAYVF